MLISAINRGKCLFNHVQNYAFDRQKAIIINKYMSTTLTTLNNDKQDSRTFFAIFSRLFLRYVSAKFRDNLNISIIFPKYLSSLGIEPATLWFCEYGISTILNRLFIYLLQFRLICIAPQHPPGPRRRSIGTKKNKKLFFHGRIDTKTHDTYVLKVHVNIRLIINVTGYDKSGKSGRGRTRASFTTGRTRFPDVVSTSAERATASLPKLSLTTRARG